MDSPKICLMSIMSSVSSIESLECLSIELFRMLSGTISVALKRDQSLHSLPRLSQINLAAGASGPFILQKLERIAPFMNHLKMDVKSKRDLAFVEKSLEYFGQLTLAGVQLEESESKGEIMEEIRNKFPFVYFEILNPE